MQNIYRYCRESVKPAMNCDGAIKTFFYPSIKYGKQFYEIKLEKCGNLVRSESVTV